MKELSLKNSRLDGKYDITDFLGRGSYAEVFAARNTVAQPGSPHSEVVIKALNVFLQGDIDIDLEKTLVENFRNEAVALDRVRHPNIVSRLGHGTARDLNGSIFHYLVLEFMTGGDLHKLCKNQGLPFSQVLDYLEQVCAGLSFAHLQNVIHRDMKPQNLLLTADHKTVKICDFGVARMSTADEPITRVGTNIYAPPEHSPMLADSGVLVSHKLTPSADIYSLGKSAYVMITGESPRRFVGAPITDLPDRYMHEPWADGLLQVLRKATQFAPSLRHQSVTEFWQDLVRVKVAAESAIDVSTLEEVDIPEGVKPQTQVSAGFTPQAPERPMFDTSRELKLSNVMNENPRAPKIVVQIGQPLSAAVGIPAKNGSVPTLHQATPADIVKPKRKGLLGTRFRRIAALAVLLFTFALFLYGTQAYLRSGGGFSWIGSYQEGVVTTNVNLRPEASARKEPIGFVPKDSRLRIVSTSDNWYEVDVIEYGSPKQDPTHADHGWVNKQYVDLR